MIPLVLEIWIYLAGLLASVVVHEIAHVVVLRRFGKNPYVWYRRGEGFNVGYPKDYLDLTKNQKRTVYSFGVVGGWLVLLIPFWFLSPVFAVGMLVVYLFGCRSDLKQMWRLAR